MTSGELQVPSGLLEGLAGRLTKAAGSVEDTAGSAPSGVDAGDLTAMIAGMISAVADNAASVSEALTAMGAQVGTAQADFWSADDAVASSYRGGLPNAD